jgi:hypothetical protein
MVEEVEFDDMIDMVDARFEIFARTGTTLGDTVLYRTRIGAGRLVPLQSHIDPECFYVLEGRLEVFLIDDVLKWNVVHAGRSLLVTDGTMGAWRGRAGRACDGLGGLGSDLR